MNIENYPKTLKFISDKKCTLKSQIYAVKQVTIFMEFLTVFL